MTVRARRGLRVATVVVGLLAMLFLVAAVRQSAETTRERALQQRGVAAAATLVRSAYDPGGGDPDGWTTDTVRFADSRGPVQQVVVGHHGDDGPERATGRIRVVFDPRQPRVAMSAQQFADATPGADLAVAVVFAVVMTGTAVALFVLALRSSKTV